MQQMAETVRQLQARQQQLEADLVQARAEAAAARGAAEPGDAGAPAPRAPAAANVGMPPSCWANPPTSPGTRPCGGTGVQFSKTTLGPPSRGSQH